MYQISNDAKPPGKEINLSPVTGKGKEAFKHEIEAADRQIDQLVSALYGLAEVEIKIVEGEN